MQPLKEVAPIRTSGGMSGRAARQPFDFSSPTIIWIC
jgi:hypothetical protein